MPAKEILLFCLVGIATTLIDFLVFNFLTRPARGWSRIPANIVSVSVAMAWSFAANWGIVFNPSGHEWMHRAGRFLATTLFSAFVLQNLVIYLCSNRLGPVVKIVAMMARRWIPVASLGEDTVSRNVSKGLAVASGLVWNFLCYKFFVYAN